MAYGDGYTVTIQGGNQGLKFSDLSPMDQNDTMAALYECVTRLLSDPVKRAEYEAFKAEYRAEQEAKAAEAAGGSK